MSAVGPVAAGAVCLHGFGGTPGSIAPLVAALGEAGLAVEAPLLPGHGTSVDDLATTTWSDWLAATEAALDALRERAAAVVLVGQSMGGALAVQLAAHRPEVAGLVCVNAPARPQPPEAVTMVEEMLAAGETQAPAGAAELVDPEATDPSYPELSLHAWLSLMAGLDGVLDAARRVRVPALVATSRHDQVVDAADGQALCDALGGPVERLVLDRGGHVAALDLDRHVLAAAVVDFVGRVTGGCGPLGPPPR